MNKKVERNKQCYCGNTENSTLHYSMYRYALHYTWRLPLIHSTAVPTTLLTHHHPTSLSISTITTIPLLLKVMTSTKTCRGYKLLLLYLVATLPICFCFQSSLQIAKHGDNIQYPSTLQMANHDGASSKKVVIVGGGIGGLATAARIQSTLPNCEVTIVEKNSEIGGRCGSFERILKQGSFRHEKGPSLLLLPDVYRDVFAACSKSGKGAEDYGLKMAQCVPAYQVVFEDGSKLNVGFPRSSGSKMSLEEVESRRIMDSFEQGGSTKWDDYMRACSAFLDCGLPNFIEEKLDLVSFPSFIQEALRDFGKAWPLKPHSDVLDAIFESEKMKALASFQDLYVGLEPYRNSAQVGGGVFQSTAPAVFGLLAAIELHPSNTKSGGKSDIVLRTHWMCC